MINTLARKLAVRRPAPDSITVSMPGAENNDFYRVNLEIPALKYHLSCKKEHKKGIEGFLWIKKTDGSPASLLKENLKKYKWTISFEHYYKGRTHEYKSGVSFLLGTLFQKHKFVRSRNNIAQAMFNKKRLVRTERIELLQRIYDNTLENPDYSVSPFSIGTELYSKRWYKHPDQRNIRNYYQLLLDSLHGSNDIEKKDNAYRLSPQALLTLSEYAKEEQRHKDNKNSAKKTRSLTLAIIVLGLSNLAFNIIKWALEDNNTESQKVEVIKTPEKAQVESSVGVQK